MRKVILFMVFSLDGFVCGPNNELDWEIEKQTTEINVMGYIEIICYAFNYLKTRVGSSNKKKEGDDIKNRENDASNEDNATRIVNTAMKYRDSDVWSYAKRKDNFKENTNKCNKFVYDILKEAKAGATGRIGISGINPTTAGAWADESKKRIGNWRLLEPGETPKPGDIAAHQQNYSDATGHVGIVVSDGQTISQSSLTDRVTVSEWGFRQDDGHIVYRRYEPERDVFYDTF